MIELMICEYNVVSNNKRLPIYDVVGTFENNTLMKTIKMHNAQKFIEHVLSNNISLNTIKQVNSQYKKFTKSQENT